METPQIIDQLVALIAVGAGTDSAEYKEAQRLVAQFKAAAPEKKTPPTREELLAEYAKKPVRRFYQLDGWRGGDVSGPFMKDDDGYVVIGSEVHELRISDWPVRVYFNQSADPTEVLTILGKIREWVEDDWKAISETEYSAVPVHPPF